MDQKEMLYLVIGAGVLYYLYTQSASAQATAATQAALNANALNANNTVTNTAQIANAATGIGTDLSNIFSAWS